MTDKITLVQLTNLQNQTTAVNNINSNSNIIQTAFDNTISRDGTSPNQMLSNFDMNSNQILNLPSPSTLQSPVRLADISTPTTIGLSVFNSFNSFNNISLSTSVNANALTVSLLDANGNNFSISSSSSINFRSATATAGTFTTIPLTSSVSITVPTGGTFGIANNTPFKLWLVAFNDGGAVRLGLINCVSNGGLYSLKAWPIVSSTLISASSTSALTFYTAGAGVTSKPYTILGYLTWETGLVTSGTWNVGPTRVQQYGFGVPLPGDSVQSVQNTGITQSTTSSTSYTASVITASMTPTSAANLVGITMTSQVINSANGIGTVAAITRGGNLIGQSTALFNTSAGSCSSPICMSVTDAPGTSANTTWLISIKVFGSGSATIGNSGISADTGWIISLTEYSA